MDDHEEGTDLRAAAVPSTRLDFEIFICSPFSLGTQSGSCGSWRAVLKRGSFGMPKRGNLRKKTDEDEGEDADDARGRHQPCTFIGQGNERDEEDSDPEQGEHMTSPSPSLKDRQVEHNSFRA